MNRWTEVVGTIGVFVLLTSVICIVVWQLAVTYRAKATLAREHEYRRLYERSTEAQENTAATLRQLAERLDDVQGHLDSVQPLLKLAGQLDDVQGRVQNVETILRSVE